MKSRLRCDTPVGCHQEPWTGIWAELESGEAMSLDFGVLSVLALSGAGRFCR